MDIRFSTRIKEVRESKGWTQLEFAEKIGCSRATYNHYENGNRHPDDVTIREICKVANISADYLLGLSYTKNPSLHAIASKTGLSEEAIQYLSFYNSSGEENAMNMLVDFFIREASFDDVFNSDNPDPFLEEQIAILGEPPVPVHEVQKECLDEHILDAIKFDWGEVGTIVDDPEYDELIESLGGEAAIDPYYYARRGEFPPDSISEMMELDLLSDEQRIFLEQQGRYIDREFGKSYFLDAVKQYLSFDADTVFLCSSQGQRRLDDEHEIILRLGNMPVYFPSEEGSKLVEDMLIQKVIDSLKRLKANFQKECSEQINE